MHGFRVSNLLMTASVLVMTISSRLSSVRAAPVQAPATSGGGGAPAAPHFVVYTDKGSEPAPDVSKISGFNTVAMSFLLTSGAADQAKAWETLAQAQKSSIKSAYQKAGIKLIVSAFGSTDLPTSSDAKSTAATMAKWVQDNNVDGIDVDYEDLNAMNAQDGKAEQWLIDFTNALRTQLPQGKYILTHAPLAPWFSASHYKSGAYTKVHKEVGSKIDWYNIQFYNQGTEYTTCDGLLTSSPTYPGSAVFEIMTGGVSADKVVIGKPGGQADATTGYMAPADLAKCVVTAKGKNWNGGVMSWEYPEADAQWIKTVKGSSFQ
ncbi:putative chitinase [Lentinula edodes]|uniref:chitinase n=1 Tax=Lentinula edodes TaxID=5353 RepID=C5NN24_LENED|nr:putative chitinase [Lentinula edodes]BAH80444.1 putative chitinase [Lentinula edodes]